MDFKFTFDADKLTWAEQESLQEGEANRLRVARGIIAKMVSEVDGHPVTVEQASEAIRNLTGKESRELINRFAEALKGAQDEAVSPTTAGG